MPALQRFAAWLSLAAWAVAGVVAAMWGYRETVRYEDQGLPLTLVAGTGLFVVIELVVVVTAWAMATSSRRPRRRFAAIAAHLVLVGLAALAWGIVEPSGARATAAVGALTALSILGAVTTAVAHSSTTGQG